MEFGVKAGAIDVVEAGRLADRCWGALCEAAASQAKHQGETGPTARFLSLLRPLLSSGRAHLEARNGGEPDRAAGACGWRRDSSGNWVPLGDCIGWVDGDHLYLEPTAAFRATQMAARDSGESFAISEPTLRKRLRDKDLLASVDEKRQTLNDPANDWWFLQRGPAFSARHRSAGSDRGWDRRCRVERCRVQCRVRCREIGQPDMDWPSAINNLGAYVGNVGYLQYEGGRENLNRSGLRGRT